MSENYSVLMSVYKKENPNFLRVSMNSMWEQTVPTNDFVLMCDGPLTPGLDKVIAEMEKAHPGTEAAVHITAAPQCHLAGESEGLVRDADRGPLVAIEHAETSCPLIETSVGGVEQHRVGIDLREVNVLPLDGKGHDKHHRYGGKTFHCGWILNVCN